MGSSSGGRGYSSIPSTDTDTETVDDWANGNDGDAKSVLNVCRNNSMATFLGLAVVLPLGLLSLGRFSVASFTSESSSGSACCAECGGTEQPPSSSLPLPTGVNLGSWLSLEDYFYVGPRGAAEVATPDDETVGMCLPPLHTGPDTGPMWNAETDLYGNLIDMEGGSVRDAIKIFHAFRTSFLDWEEELSQMAKLGIHHVRVPLSWCLTDHDPSNDDILGMEEDTADTSEKKGDYDAELHRRYTCVDPFFSSEAEAQKSDPTDDDDEVRWPAVPRPFLVSFLKVCAKHNIKVNFDLHTYPGGTSPGTFSGVWPRRPLFWKYDDPENVNNDVGRKLFRDFLTWVESLKKTDPAAFSGLGAITAMNEPAHLAGLFGPGSANPTVKSYLPSLPERVAKDYLVELNGNGETTQDTIVPDGPHLRALLWQRDAVALFRSTTLPDSGITLFINVHESIFTPSLVPADMDDDEKLAAATAIFGAWWAKTTTPEERATWAVIDMHRYHAWGPTCQGTVDGPPTGNYTCGDEEGTAQTLGRCAGWAGMYRDVMNEQLGDDDSARLASAEFSASTHHSVLHSCTDTTTLRKTYLAQVEAGNDAGVELFWWSWKMPHGGAFRPAWSFKHFLHRLGVDGFGPDESELICGR